MTNPFLTRRLKHACTVTDESTFEVLAIPQGLFIGMWYQTATGYSMRTENGWDMRYNYEKVYVGWRSSC